MSTNRGDAGAGASTFTQLKRRDQLVDCAIDAVAELGFPRTSVAEVARRAGVSKGVVTYHFAAKDDLIGAVIAHVLGSMTEYVQPRLLAAEPLKFPERFIAPYIGTWVEYFRDSRPGSHRAGQDLQQLPGRGRAPEPGLRRARGRSNRSRAGPGARAGEGPAREPSPPGSWPASLKAVLDDLLTQFAADPELDLEAYGTELVALFERAARPDPGASCHRTGPGTTCLTAFGGEMKPYFDTNHIAGLLLLVVVTGLGSDGIQPVLPGAGSQKRSYQDRRGNRAGDLRGLPDRRVRLPLSGPAHRPGGRDPARRRRLRRRDGDPGGRAHAARVVVQDAG